MAARDYYEVLQVTPTAEHEVVEAAYKRLAFKYHPDRNSASTAAATMQELNDAYQTLSDPQRRQEYDSHKKMDVPTGQSAPPAGLGRWRDWVRDLFDVRLAQHCHKCQRLVGDPGTYCAKCGVRNPAIHPSIKREFVRLSLSLPGFMMFAIMMLALSLFFDWLNGEWGFGLISLVSAANLTVGLAALPLIPVGTWWVKKYRGCGSLALERRWTFLDQPVSEGMPTNPSPKSGVRWKREGIIVTILIVLIAAGFYFDNKKGGEAVQGGSERQIIGSWSGEGLMDGKARKNTEKDIITYQSDKTFTWDLVVLGPTRFTGNWKISDKDIVLQVTACDGEPRAGEPLTVRILGIEPNSFRCRINGAERIIVYNRIK
jgi:DnaJ domain